MKVFTLIELQWEKFMAAVKESLSKSLSKYTTNLGPNTIFGQLINVLGSACQNLLYYIEDSMTEQNKYTAERTRSIYNLAELSGYNPSLGKATTAVLKVSWKPNNLVSSNVIIKNKASIINNQNGYTYNVVLPQESIVLNLDVDTSSKYITVVEGTFETQQFIAEGGQLYSKNIKFVGNCDIDYLTLSVDGEPWERVESIYDMDPEGKQYVARTSLKSGIDIIFGNSQYGKCIKDRQTVRVEYLIHNGEAGNLISDDSTEFLFADKLNTLDGEEVDASEILKLELLDREYITSGTYADDTEMVRNMIGMNSRALVLADSKNYNKLFKKFSFVGYNRVWTEPGSLVVNAIIMRNYKAYLNNGSDYFNLSESDFILSESQKSSIYNSIAASGEQLAGSVFNIFDPELCKYACYAYVKLKNGDYDESIIAQQIRTEIGKFFADIQSDIYIPKSDIIHLLKKKISAIDGVNIYFLSSKNEKALIDKQYVKKEYTYNPVTTHYNIKETTVYLLDDENPNLGLDSHGNILLDNNDQFPVLMGGWFFSHDENSRSVSQSPTITVNDPLTIIFE